MTNADRGYPQALGAPSVGVGFKAEHFEPIVETRPELGFFEVHAENYMGAGGPPHRRLDAIRERYPLSLHGVGLSIGSPGPLDRDASCSGSRRSPSASSRRWFPSTWPGRPTRARSSTIFCPCPTPSKRSPGSPTISTRCRTRLGRTMLLENPSTYVVFAESTFAETDFLREIARRTGCGLLLDVNNVFVSATNHGYDPYRYLADFPLRRGRRNPSRRLCRGQRRRRPAAPDRRPQFAGPRRRVVALRRGDLAARGHADPDRMGQRPALLADASWRGAPGRARHGGRNRESPGARRCRLRRRSAPSRRRSASLRPPRRR